jgi:hypothetical protein
MNKSQSLFVQIFILRNSSCQALCVIYKKFPHSLLQCSYIFWSFGIIDFSTSKRRKFSSTNAGARVIRDVAPFHYRSCSDPIKPNLQFSCNFIVIIAFGESLFLLIALISENGTQTSTP